MNQKLCKIKNCKNKVRIEGYCLEHWKLKRRKVRCPKCHKIFFTSNRAGEHSKKYKHYGDYNVR